MMATVMLDDHDFPMLPVAAMVMVADMNGNAFFSARRRRRQGERESADGGERQNDSAHVVFLWGGILRGSMRDAGRSSAKFCEPSFRMELGQA
jgi:hypothetical protein